MFAQVVKRKAAYIGRGVLVGALLSMWACTLPSLESNDAQVEEPAEVTSLGQLQWKKGDKLTNARRVTITPSLSGPFAQSATEDLPDIRVVIKELNGQERLQTNLRYMAKFGGSFMLADYNRQVKAEVFLPSEVVEKTITFHGNTGILDLHIEQEDGE